MVLQAATVKRPRPRYYVGRHEGGRREHLAADNRALTPRMDLRAEPLIPIAYSWLVLRCYDTAGAGSRLKGVRDFGAGTPLLQPAFLACGKPLNCYIRASNEFLA